MILEPFHEFLMALVLTPLLLVTWVAVQRSWSRAFNRSLDAEDALECRGGCGACGPGACRGRTGTKTETQSGDPT
jgi:hypothetical protein